MEKNNRSFQILKKLWYFSLLVLSEKFNPVNESTVAFVL